MRANDQRVGWSPWLAVLAIVSTGLQACMGARESPGARGDALIYGDDDRVDVYAQPDPALRALASSSVVALIPWRLVAESAGAPRLVAAPSAASAGLCQDQAFASQPTAASCTGVLIDRDLVLTAAHCLQVDASQRVACDDRVFAFDYAYRGPEELTPWTDDALFRCRDVLVAEHSAAVGGRLDYAIVQLDRPAPEGRVPVSLRQRALTAGAALITIGFPNGQPAKIDAAARAIDPRPALDSFTLTTDAFEGSSGSPVFDTQRQLVGVLASGGLDFEASDAGCVVARVIPEGATPGLWERATYAARAVDALCDTGWSSAQLCGAAGGNCALAKRPRRPRTPRAPIEPFVLALAAAVWCRRRQTSAARITNHNERVLCQTRDNS